MAILALIGGVRFSAYIEEAKLAKVKADIKTVYTAVEMVVSTNRDLSSRDVNIQGKDPNSKLVKEISEFTGIPADDFVRDYAIAVNN